MNKEEYIEEGINGQWTNWKFEAENNKRIYEELLKRIDKAIGYIEKGSYKDLYNIKSIDELLRILKGDSNE